MKEEEKAILLLEDGTVFEGQAMGARGKTPGTVVFHTSMVGYQEALTNPANCGLLLTLTFPLIGNYGINDRGWESDKVRAAGLIVREHCAAPSNYLSKGTLDAFLAENGVVGICGIDTRRLTRHIREKGEMKGMIVSEGTLDIDALLPQVRAYIPESAVRSVSRSGSGVSVIGSCDSKEKHDVSARPNIGVLDLGASRSMLDALLANGANLLHCSSDAQAVKALMERDGIDGLVISDGPGNPDADRELIDNVREISGLGLPILGISLGHQILALANGMQVKRLRCGHRGANQPVLSVLTGRTYITSQNHAFAVDEKSVDPAVCEVSFVNANDRTCEGLRYKNGSAFSVQFLPDAQAHTHSTAFVYGEFMQLAGDAKASKKGGM